MTFKEALRIKYKDILYTHSGDRVVISGWHQNFDNPCISDDLYFHCINTGLQTVYYRYNELCGPELCDEDKMFINWLENTEISDIELIIKFKSAFLHGFHCGFSHKMRNKSEEQLQK